MNILARLRSTRFQLYVKKLFLNAKKPISFDIGLIIAKLFSCER